MAIKAPASKPCQSLGIKLLTLILLGWLILMFWVSSIWYLSGFSTALSAVIMLAQKQIHAIAEFNYLPIANPLKSLACSIPTQELTNRVVNTRTFIKDELGEIFPEKNKLQEAIIDLTDIAKKIGLLIFATLKLLLIKLLILFLSIPLFLMMSVAGLIDGLSQRAIRKASLGRESSYVFHKLYHYFKRTLFLLLSLWIAIPVSVTPAFVFVPVSLLLSIMASITVSRFKKYL